MASPASKPVVAERLEGQGLYVGVVSARWNADICDALTAGAVRAISRTGADALHASAPGAFELPFAAKVLAERGDVDAIVVVGCVIRGETTHYELVSEGCAQGISHVQLTTGVPIGLGIVTVEHRDQALARSQGDGGHNVGEDAAAVCGAVGAMEAAAFGERRLGSVRPVGVAVRNPRRAGAGEPARRRNAAPCRCSGIA